MHTEALFPHKMPYRRDQNYVLLCRITQDYSEAVWFYRFLSIIYDHDINPEHLTEDMQEDLLEPADLYSKDLIVLDVRDVCKHGLIMGYTVTCVKQASTDSPFKLEPKVEDVK